MNSIVTKLLSKEELKKVNADHKEIFIWLLINPQGRKLPEAAQLWAFHTMNIISPLVKCLFIQLHLVVNEISVQAKKTIRLKISSLELR